MASCLERGCLRAAPFPPPPCPTRGYEGSSHPESCLKKKEQWKDLFVCLWVAELSCSAAAVPSSHQMNPLSHPRTISLRLENCRFRKWRRPCRRVLENIWEKGLSCARRRGFWIHFPFAGSNGYLGPAWSHDSVKKVVVFWFCLHWRCVAAAADALRGRIRWILIFFHCQCPSPRKGTRPESIFIAERGDSHRSAP